jgi:hypothetical protein
MQGEFLRLLFLQGRRETEAHFTAVGMLSQNYQTDTFRFKRAAFFQSLKSKIGLAASRIESGGVEDQPQYPGLWHSGSSSARSFSCSPSSPPPSFTQYPSPPCSLVRDGPTSPLSGLGFSSLVAHILYYPPPPREKLCNRYCSNKHTHTSLFTAVTRRGGRGGSRKPVS